MGYRREVPYRGGGVVAAADRQRRDTIPCLPRYACSRHPHQNPHPHSSTHQSINQSIGQALLLTQSSQSRQIESYRVRGAASLHHAARRSLKSPPGGLAHLSLPVPAALPCCYPFCAVAFHLGLGGWAGAGRTRAVRTIPGRVRVGLFTDTVCNELVVRGGDDRQLLHATRG